MARLAIRPNLPTRLLLCAKLLFLSAQSLYSATDSLDIWLAHAALEVHSIQVQYEKLTASIRENIRLIDAQILTSPAWRYRKRERLWQEKRLLETSLQDLEAEKEMRLLKTRYKRGIDLIKLLYEKILALDHHFSSMRIFQNVMMLSNPNSYAGFQKTRDLLEEQLKKKNAFQLPPLLHSNPYLTATFSLVAAVVGDGEPKARQKDFQEISCILDFTLRMGGELSIIQRETEYLKNANQNLKNECERLFEDYVKVVGYIVPLDKCRTSDDWEKVYLLLDEFVRGLEIETGPTRWTREQVNLEFATQRVADFIAKYQGFVTQGAQYYQKFNNIVSTYENEEVCKQDLPRQFDELRKDIRQTIDKFSNTYILPEIQGSRLKDLLYGTID